ncbi:hypothetical protein Tco_0285439 [Tanacetum coccineum]
MISIDNSNDPLLELPEFESFHFDPSLPRPPPEPPDVCLDMLYNDESFEPGEGENIVVSNVEEDDSFTFTIRTFLPFLTYPEVSPLSCSTGSEDLIFDPGIITFHFLKPLAFLWKINPTISEASRVRLICPVLLELLILCVKLVRKTAINAESDLRELEYLLNHDPIKEMDSILEDSVDENSPNDNLVDTISEMFTDEHALDYSSPPLWDDYDDELFDLETVNDDTYDDPFYSKEEKIKDSKILIDELDPPRSSDFLPFPECDSVFYEDFSEVDALSSTNNEDKVFNPGILIHENLFEVTNCATPEKNVKKPTNASLILEDFNPPLYELPFHKEVPGLGALLLFSSENEEKVFNPGILTSKRVHTSLLPELSHRDSKAFKVIKIFESPMEIFPCSYGEDIRVLDVPCLHFYPP